MQPYRILGIAPYEGFRGFFVNAIKGRPDIQADIYSASLHEAAELVQSLDLSKYEVIICRGRSGKIVKEVSSIPVVNVDFSTFDILRGLELALLNSHKKMAFVSFFELGSTIPMLCELSGYTAPLLTPPTPSSAEEMEQLIRRLHEEEGIELFIGDGACVHCARNLGVESILITSGPESMENAISRAVEICDIKRRLVLENSFHKAVIEQTELPIAIFSEKKEMIYSKLFNDCYSQELHQSLRDHTAKVLQHGKIKWMISVETQSWKIYGERIRYNEKNFILYYVMESLSHLSKDRQYLEIISPASAEQCYRMITANPALSECWKRSKEMIDSKTPILLYGSVGAGKKTFACALYSVSRLNQNPLLAVDCRFLDDKSLAKLFEDDRSPLLEKNCTVLFKNIEALSLPLQNRLSHDIRCLELTERSKIIATLSGDPNTMLHGSRLSKELYYILIGFSVRLPDLSETPEQLTAIARSYLNELNQQLPVQLVGFEPGALKLFEDFHWEFGISQFKMVLKQLSYCTSGQFISKENVERVLSEIHLESSAPRAASAISLEGTLDDIIKDVIQKVLEEENMNQTKTAKRLNISRGMLWKRLKS